LDKFWEAADDAWCVPQGNLVPMSEFPK
jgi:hypothetical protein